MKRVVTPELLDAEDWAPSEIERALADLRLINRWFGGIGTTAAMLERVARECGLRALSLLDVGGADGHLARQVARRLGRRGISMRAVVADRVASHLRHQVPGVSADATALPFRNGSFDAVACALVVHHLAPDVVRTFACEALRVCRHAVLINDLRRSAVHLGLVYAGFPLFRSPLTRNDGPASVRAAYTPEEVRELLRDVPGRVEIHNSYLYRMQVIVWKA